MDTNMSGETLPAIRSSHSSPGPSMSRSQSGSASTSGNGNGTKGFSDNNNMGVTLPPIHSLMGRSSSSSSRTIEHHGHGHGDGSYRQSPPEQHQPMYMRKRANEPAVDHHGRPIGGREASGSPPANKRRRVDVEPSSSERNGIHSESMRQHHRSISSSGPNPHQQQQQQQHNSTRSRHSHEPPRIQPAPTSSTGSSLKQEVISPPAVLVQSPATPSVHSNITPTSSTIAISDPPSSFSRRISNSAASPSSTGRPTPRKLPPSRLNFQPSSGAHGGGGGGGHAHHASLAAVPPPSIRSAPPIPVHRDGHGSMQMQQTQHMQMHVQLAPLAASSTASGSGSHDNAGRGTAGASGTGEGGTWLPGHPPTQSRATHPPGQNIQGAPHATSSSHSHSRSHSLHQAAQQQQQSYSSAAPQDSATPRASTFARDRDGWPTVPTPTSLRLGSRPIVPPPLYNASQVANNQSQSPGPGVSRFPTTPSVRGHIHVPGGGGGHGTPLASRFPPTPGLGAGTSRTPAMLSPIPPLGHAHYGGQAGRNEAAVDKSKFMQKMSEMYDRASSSRGAHNAQRECGCLSAEEVDRRLKERDVEIGMLREALEALGREMEALRGLFRGGAVAVAGRVDGDGDVSMAVDKVASTSTVPTAGEMDVDTRSGTPSNQAISNGDAILNVSFKHHRSMASRAPNSLSSEKGTTAIVPIPPAVPAIPKAPIATQNGKAASTTPSPFSTREDTPTAGMNGMEGALKPSGKSGEVGEVEEAMKA